MLIDLSADAIEFLRAELASEKHDDPKSHAVLGELIEAQENGVEMTQITRAMSAMPYSASMSWGSSILSPKDLPEWLGALRGILRRVADEKVTIERERDILKRQRATVRAFMGLPIESPED